MLREKWDGAVEAHGMGPNEVLMDQRTLQQDNIEAKTLTVISASLYPTYGELYL